MEVMTFSQRQLQIQRLHTNIKYYQPSIQHSEMLIKVQQQFKDSIAFKYEKSTINKTYIFPKSRLEQEESQEQYCNNIEVTNLYQIKHEISQIKANNIKKQKSKDSKGDKQGSKKFINLQKKQYYSNQISTAINLNENIKEPELKILLNEVHNRIKIKVQDPNISTKRLKTETNTRNRKNKQQRIITQNNMNERNISGLIKYGKSESKKIKQKINQTYKSFRKSITPTKKLMTLQSSTPKNNQLHNIQNNQNKNRIKTLQKNEDQIKKNILNYKSDKKISSINPIPIVNQLVKNNKQNQQEKQTNYQKYNSKVNKDKSKKKINLMVTILKQQNQKDKTTKINKMNKTLRLGGGISTQKYKKNKNHIKSQIKLF